MQAASLLVLLAVFGSELETVKWTCLMSEEAEGIEVGTAEGVRIDHPGDFVLRKPEGHALVTPFAASVDHGPFVQPETGELRGAGCARLEQGADPSDRFLPSRCRGVGIDRNSSRRLMVALSFEESMGLSALKDGMNPWMPPSEPIAADRVIVEQEIVNGVLFISGSAFEVWPKQPVDPLFVQCF